MRILMFTPYVPYPPNSGGQTRTFNLIKNLSRKHEIVSFSFLRTDHPEPDLTELRKYCSKIQYFRRKKSWASPSKIVITGFSPYPYLANMYNYSSVKRAIAAELGSTRYDLIHLETYYIMPNIPATTVPVLLAEQTIEYLVYQHYAQTSPLIPLKPLFYIDAAKHKFWEKYYWQKAKKVVAMSEDDKSKMLQIAPNLDVGVVPNGVDIPFFEKKLQLPSRKYPILLFVGNFNWLQNREAAVILVQNIWPQIKKKLPNAKLWIVGREPTDSIRNLATQDIKVSSDIEDIRQAYQASDLLIAPLYGGGGTRYKILEAMASMLPVVATEIGIEGLGAKNETHALISNSKEELANLSVAVINNKKMAQSIARNAKNLVADDFDWSKISARLDQIYEQTAKNS